MDQAIQYAIEQIPQIIPLEEQDVRSLCQRVLKGSRDPETIANEFLNILGHSDATFEFIFRFNELLSKEPKSGAIVDTSATAHKGTGTGATTKAPTERVSTSRAPPPENKVIKQKANATIPKGQTVSMMLSGKKKHSTSKKQSSVKSQKLKSLEEIDDVVKFLSITHKETDPNKYACSCQGRRHPIFAAAPNCLSCGKIICVREGLNLNNCTFCGQELIPIQERVQLIEALNQEKEALTDDNNQRKGSGDGGSSFKKKPLKTYKISTEKGKNLFEEQNKVFDYIERQKERERKREKVMKELGSGNNVSATTTTEASKSGGTETDEELQKAQERLEQLLYFQDTAAERTKIIDNASDFDMSQNVGLWGSARERALLLKKQQRNLRKWEKLERERTGRRDKYVVSMNIGADGKVSLSEVKRNYDNVYANSDEDLDEVSDEEDRRDLEEIKAYKEELAREKERTNKELQSRAWDYRRDKMQFERPIYVEKAGNGNKSDGNETKQYTDIDKDILKQRSRIQFAKNGDISLEENILAVL